MRIDAVGSHTRSRGLVLSGVKFHAPLGIDGFLREVETLLAQTFAASRVEETDLWTTVPIAVGKGTVVSGDFAKPTSRVVFAVTVRRREAAGLAGRLRSGDGVYWAGDWKTALSHGGSAASRGPKP